MIFFDQFLGEVAVGSFSSLLFEEEWFKQNPESSETQKQVQLTEVSRAKLGKSQPVPTLGEAGMVKAMFSHENQNIWLQRFYELAEVASFYIFEPISQAANSQLNSIQEGGDDSATARASEIQIYLPAKTCVFEMRSQTFQAATLSILIHERAPNEFEFFKISRSRSRNRMVAEYVEPEVARGEFQIVEKLNLLLQRLSVELTGVEQVDVREKIGTGEARKRVGIRTLHRVAPPNVIQDVTPLGRKAIDWNHSGE